MWGQISLNCGINIDLQFPCKLKQHHIPIHLFLFLKENHLLSLIIFSALLHFDKFIPLITWHAIIPLYAIIGKTIKHQIQRSVIFEDFSSLYRIFRTFDRYDNTRRQTYFAAKRAVIINSPLRSAPKSTRHTTQNRERTFVHPLTVAPGT